MKILIIGAGGFVGTYLTENLSKKHEVYPLYKDTIDLRKSKYLIRNKIRKYKQKIFVDIHVILV